MLAAYFTKNELNLFLNELLDCVDSFISTFYDIWGDYLEQVEKSRELHLCTWPDPFGVLFSWIVVKTKYFCQEATYLVIFHNLALYL